MNDNLLVGFIMAGVSVILALIGFLLYCFIGLDCHLIDKEESTVRDLDSQPVSASRPTLDSHGNPIVSGIHAPNFEV
jgi:hypothetical protein